MGNSDDDIARGMDSAIRVTGWLIGGTIRQRQSSRNAQIERLAEQSSRAIETGDYDKALEVGQSLVKMGGKGAQMLGYSMSGIALRFLGRYEEAISSLTRALDRMRELGHAEVLGEIYGHRGCCHFEIDNLANAIADFNAAITADPGNEFAYLWRGIALRQLGDLGRSLNDFDQAISINPSEANSYHERGCLYLQMQQPQQAIEDFTRAIKLDSTSASSYKLRGQAYTSIGDHTRAVADFSQAIVLRQSDVEARLLRVASYQALGQLAQAQADQRDLAVLTTALSIYDSYLETAHARYQEGMTKWYTEADTHANVSWPLFAMGVGVGVFPFMCIGTTYSAYGRFAIVLYILTLLLSVVTMATAFVAPRIEAKRAATFLAKLAEYEQQKPAFSQFYERYLAARRSGSLGDLAEQTLMLFQSGGPARRGQQ